MSTVSSGIPRDKRLKIIRQLLHRWGRMSKEQLDEQVSRILECDSDAAFKRTLYRDLDYLVNEGDVVDHRFSADGTVISDYNPDKHKNTRVQWSLRGEENQILGGSLLEQVKGSFLCSKILTRDFAIDEAVEKLPTFQTIHFYFSIGHAFLCLRFNLAAVSAKILVARSLSDPNSAIDIEGLEKHFGRRLGVLSLPVPTLSSSICGDRPGHFIIEVPEAGSVTVQDLNSTNGTSVCRLSMGQVDEMRKKGSLLGDSTITSSWWNPKCTPLQFMKVESGKPISVSPPVLIQASEKFRMLIV